jgi:hypothetical protein
MLQRISCDLIAAASECQTVTRHFETERNDISGRFMAQLLIPINLNNLKQENGLHIFDVYRADLREEITNFILKILLTIPPSTATAEISFSVLKRA